MLHVYRLYRVSPCLTARENKAQLLMAPHLHATGPEFPTCQFKGLQSEPPMPDAAGNHHQMHFGSASIITSSINIKQYHVNIMSIHVTCQYQTEWLVLSRQSSPVVLACPRL